jgi:quercetin dioxygenase-like cupin family protein
MVRHESESEGTAIEGNGAVGVAKRIVIGTKDGYDGFLRVFTIAVGGHSPYHSHPWFHATYILEGEGKVVIDGKDHPVRAGSAAYIEGGKMHNLVNTGTGPFRFICIVPKEGDSY